MLMEERRHWKNNLERHEELDREVKTKCRERKEGLLNQQCEEMEELIKMRLHRRMHKKIKGITGNRRPKKTSTITDKRRNILMDIMHVSKRWEEYGKNCMTT